MAARANRQAPRTASDRELTITRVFSGPRPLVYEMWTTGEHMSRWCCPREFTVVSAGGELRAGGAWHMDMRSPDGQDFRLRGSYREIVPNERLVFTHAWLDAAGRPGHETVVTVIFADESGRTRLTFHQAAFDSLAARDGHAGGWSESLDGLAAYLASRAQSRLA